MELQERMMIMGLCLQGILANPALPLAIEGDRFHGDRAQSHVDLAIQYANKLEGRLETEPKANRIAQLTKTAYEVCRAADADGAGKWPPFDFARQSMAEEHGELINGVFERVAVMHQADSFEPETHQDRLIWAVVQAG